MDTGACEGQGVRGIMDFLAEEPCGGVGTGCPGLKQENGRLAPTIVHGRVPEDNPQ